jgi:DNA-binding transcriptional MerR regulator
MSEEEDGPPLPGEYTIDELAARSGIPSRTIRFYQAKGVLPAPRKRGRVAVYDKVHEARLQIVGELQDKGLRLRAIRDIISREDLDSDAIHRWLGVGEKLGSMSKDVPALLTEDELRKELGDPPPGLLSRLVSRGVLQVQGEGVTRRYLVHSPALLAVGRRLREAGIDIEVSVTLREILERRLARAAREVVDYAIKHLGQGFGRSRDPEDVMAAVVALLREDIGGEAVRLVYIKEVERVLGETLKNRGIEIVAKPESHAHAHGHGRNHGHGRR